MEGGSNDSDVKTVQPSSGNSTWHTGKSILWFDDLPSYKPPFIREFPNFFHSFLCFPIFLGRSPACHVDTVKRAPRDRGPNTWAVHDACSIGGLDDQLIRVSWDGNSQGAIAFLGELLSHVRYPATLW